jgi:hypothetical protein
MGHRQAARCGVCNQGRSAGDPGARAAWRGAVKQAESYRVGRSIPKLHDRNLRTLDGDCLLCFAEGVPM